MRRFTSFTVIGLGLVAACSLHGQPVPATINYQGRLTDNTPSQMPINATVQMQFAIYDAPAGGTRLWQEPALDNTGAAIAVTSGIFNYVLGNAVALPSSVFTGATSIRYLQITLNPAATAEILAPRQLITATGYAKLAQSANDSGALGGSAAASWQLKLSSNCGGGQALTGFTQTGTPTCAVVGAGTVTNVTVSAPLSVVTGTTTPAISLTSPLPLANGGSGANLSVTGGAGQVLKQTTSGAAISVASLAATEIPNLDASKINSGNLAAAQLPTGGAWPLTGSLTFPSNLLVVDPAGFRVGVGTVPTTDRLEVSGNIAVKNFGGYRQSGTGGEVLRTIRGTVGLNGSIIMGTGYTVSKTGTGVYVINFTTPFGNQPTLTATLYGGYGVPLGSTPGTGSVTLNILATTGAAPVDNAFMFIAVGPP